MNKKILIVIFGVILLAGAVYLAYVLIGNRDKQVSCTMEAKLCSDGSVVGRIGPNCEFALCPEEISIPGWKTFSDNQQGIEFQYPEKLPTNFMSVTEWPPKITISEESLFCPEAPPGNDLTGPIRGIINNHIYCVGATVGAAAGSTYAEYTYATEKNGKLITLNFTLQSPQCDNYEDPQKTQCQDERSTFDLDGTIDQIIQSVKINN